MLGTWARHQLFFPLGHWVPFAHTAAPFLPLLHLLHGAALAILSTLSSPTHCSFLVPLGHTQFRSHLHCIAATWFGPPGGPARSASLPSATHPSFFPSAAPHHSPGWGGRWAATSACCHCSASSRPGLLPRKPHILPTVYSSLFLLFPAPTVKPAHACPPICPFCLGRRRAFCIDRRPPAQTEKTDRHSLPSVHRPPRPSAWALPLLTATLLT